MLGKLLFSTLVFVLISSLSWDVQGQSLSNAVSGLCVEAGSDALSEALRIDFLEAFPEADSARILDSLAVEFDLNNEHSPAVDNQGHSIFVYIWRHEELKDGQWVMTSDRQAFVNVDTDDDCKVLNIEY